MLSIQALMLINIEYFSGKRECIATLFRKRIYFAGFCIYAFLLKKANG